jgi:hypothetical protein
VQAFDPTINAQTVFTQGGVARFDAHARGGAGDPAWPQEAAEGYYGWGGYGGSMMMW